jgi:hypothetical protein
LHILALQSKDGTHLFERPSSRQIIEKIWHQKIHISRVDTLEQLKVKLLSSENNEIDLVYFDYKSYKALDSEELTGVWSESYENLVSNDFLSRNSSGETLFVPIIWSHSTLLNKFQQCSLNIPFFVEGFALPKKLSPPKVHSLSLKIKTLLLHPGFQKLLSLLPYGFTIKDDLIVDELRSLIAEERKSSSLNRIPLSER